MNGHSGGHSHSMRKSEGERVWERKRERDIDWGVWFRERERKREKERERERVFSLVCIWKFVCHKQASPAKKFCWLTWNMTKSEKLCFVEHVFTEKATSFYAQTRQMTNRIQQGDILELCFNIISCTKYIK